MKAKLIIVALSLFSAGSRMTRGVACLVCFVLTLACAADSLHHGRLIFQPEPADASAKKIIALRSQELRQDDPQAAKRLDALVGRHSPHALAAGLEATYQREGPPGLRDVAHGETSSIELASLALDPELNQTAQHREGFLTAHATVVEVLQRSFDDFQPEEYLRRIRRLSEDAQWWDPVRDDPVTLLVFEEVSDPVLRQFWLEQRDWLAEVLIQLQPTEVEEAGVSRDGEETTDSEKGLGPSGFAELIEVAREYHPLPKRAVLDHEFGAVGFQVFLDFGGVLKESVEQHNLSLEETLEVVFANVDFIEDVRQKQGSDEATAAMLKDVYIEKPAVWEFARDHPRALRFADEAPKHADSVLERFGRDGVMALLYTEYEDEIAPAAAALHHFGDPALYVLNAYADDEEKRLHKFLRNPDVGPRAVPFLVRFGDGGFDKLNENKAWLDRYFHADGTPKESGWWEGVPLLGAPLKILENWSNGHPSEWSELGWAAVDAADGALLVASLGGSTGLTAVKIGARKLPKNEARRQIRRAARDRARTSAAGSRQITQGGPRLSLLRRTSSSISSILKSGTTLVARGRYALSAPGKAVVDGTRKVQTSWTAVSPRIRRIVYRSLLAAGLYATIRHRTIPSMGRIGEELGNFVRELAEGSRDLLANAILDLLRLDPDSPIARRVIRLVTGLLLAIIFGVLAWRLRPWKRRLRYVS